MTTNQTREDGRQVETLYRIMCAEFGKVLSVEEMSNQVTEILTVATNMVTDYHVRVMEAPAGLLRTPDVQTAVPVGTNAEPLTGDSVDQGVSVCRHCRSTIERNPGSRIWSHSYTRIRSCDGHTRRNRTNANLIDKAGDALVRAEAPRPFTRAAYDAVQAVGQPVITKDMVERPANPEPVAKGHADAGTTYRRRIGEVAPGYTHLDAYAFSRQRKAELEEPKGRLITVRELTDHDLGKEIVVTLSDGHQISGMLTHIEYVSQAVHRLRLVHATYSKEPASGRGARQVKVNTDRPVRVSDR